MILNRHQRRTMYALNKKEKNLGSWKEFNTTQIPQQPYKKTNAKN